MKKSEIMNSAALDIAATMIQQEDNEVDISRTICDFLAHSMYVPKFYVCHVKNNTPVHNLGALSQSQFSVRMDACQMSSKELPKFCGIKFSFAYDIVDNIVYVDSNVCMNSPSREY